MSNAPDIKVVLLGHKNVGKTSIFNRYVYDEFGKTSMTIGAYFAMKQCRIKDKSYQLAIWDTAGEEKFDSLTNFYCRNAKAAIICYDITSLPTFQNLQRWVDKISVEAEQNCAIVIVGNKLDLVEENPSLRRVDFGDAKRYAKTINAEAFEVCAASGKGVHEVFQKVVLTSVQRNSNSKSPEEESNGKKLVNLKQKGKESCC